MMPSRALRGAMSAKRAKVTLEKYSRCCGSSLSNHNVLSAWPTRKPLTLWSRDPPNCCKLLLDGGVSSCISPGSDLCMFCVLLNKRADADGGVAEREPARWRSRERRWSIQVASRRFLAADPVAKPKPPDR